LRRRRRPPTRPIKRISSFDPNTAFQKKQDNSKKSKSFFKVLFWIIVVAAICWYAYFNFYLPSDSDEMVILDSSTTESTIIKADTIKEHVFKKPEKKIKIEILNGCGVTGIAKIFKSYLRQQGFDVVNTENYRILGKINWNLQNSKVIDQIGKIDNANSVAQSLGIDEKFVSSVKNQSPICDVTVVIGKDFKEIKGFKEFSK
jgi:hypothetical protein